MLNFILFFIVLELSGHPVGYKGGWMNHLSISDKERHFEVNYTFLRHTSFGFDYSRLTTSNDIQEVGYLRLAQRFRQNLPESQANFYILTGIGGSNSERLAKLFEIQLDWEDRNLYFLSRGRWDDLSKGNSRVLELKVGASPTKVDYDSWTPWIFTKIKLQNQDEDVGSAIRVFNANILNKAILLEATYWIKNGFEFELMVYF